MNPPSINELDELEEGVTILRDGFSVRKSNGRWWVHNTDGVNYGGVRFARTSRRALVYIKECMRWEAERVNLG